MRSTRDPPELIIGDQKSSEAGEAGASIHLHMGQEFQRDQCWWHHEARLIESAWSMRWDFIHGARAPRVSSEVPMQGRHPKWQGWPGVFRGEVWCGMEQAKLRTLSQLLISDYLFGGSGGAESLLARFSVIFRHSPVEGLSPGKFVLMRVRSGRLSDLEGLRLSPVDTATGRRP